MTVEEAIAVVEMVLEQGRLNKVQEIVLRQSWEGQSYMEIARSAGYDAGYLKDVGSELWQKLSHAFGVKVTKHNFQGVLKRNTIPHNASATTHTVRLSAHGEAPHPIPQIDWGDAIDVSIFYGRKEELDILKQWLLQDHCRLVTLLGMGGMGKTALSVKLARKLVGREGVEEWRSRGVEATSSPPLPLSPTPHHSFESVIWRSLRDAPPIHELLTTLIKFLSGQQESPLPESVGGKLSRLLELLRQSRCLVILDNFDAVLEAGQRTGVYREGYRDYGELLRRVGEIAHQSCFVLTSREKPQEIAALEGEKLPIRTLSMTGLDTIAGQNLLSAKGLTGSLEATTQLIEHYRGNPLALKIAATSIQDLFAGDICQFLDQGTVAFNGIGNLLRQQCDRLSPLEKHIMYWLAIEREAVSTTGLQSNLVPEISRARLMEALESLCWRGLMESNAIGFTQQPVIMEYTTDCLIEQITQEIVTEAPSLFLSHALIKAQAKDYIRESQIRVILQPILTRLLTELGSPKQAEHKLTRLLNQLRETQLKVPGYGAGNLLNLFCQLETDLSEYDFSHLPIYQAYLQDASLNQVNFTQTQFANCAFAATFGGITCVAFSPDGQQLATSDTNGEIQIWNATRGEQLFACKGHNSWVWSVVFSPDHTLLASCGQDHTVRLWNTQTGQCLKILEGHTSIVTSVAFSPDAGVLASASEDQTIRLWNLDTGACWKILTGHQACVWSVVFHPSERILISGGEDGAIRFWNLDTGDCSTTLKEHQQWIKTVAISVDGRTLASGSFDQTLKLWDWQTATCLRTLRGHGAPITSISFSPDGKSLASSSYDQSIKLWQVSTGTCVKTLQKHTNRIWSVTFDSTGTRLASGGDDNTARIWEVSTGLGTKTLQGHSNSIYAIAWSPDQHLLASGHEDQTIKLWDLDLKAEKPASNQMPHLPVPKLPFRVLRGHTNRVLSVAFSREGTWLASASLDRTIKLWNPHTGHCLTTLEGHTSWVWAVAFSPDGTQLASASYDHTIKLWDVPSGKCLQTLEGHTSSVLAIAFSPEGNQLLSGGYEQTIKRWNVATGQCLQTLQGHTNRVWTVAFSPDGQQFATGGDDQAIQVWETATGKALQVLKGHTSQILSVQFSTDATLLISSSADGTIRLWELATGTCLKTLAGHHSWVWSTLLDLNTATLLSSSQDETIRCWNIHTSECWQTLRAPRPYEGMNITGASGLTEAQQATLLALGAVQHGVTQ